MSRLRNAFLGGMLVLIWIGLVPVESRISPLIEGGSSLSADSAVNVTTANATWNQASERIDDTSTRPDVLLIITDDQNYTSASAMPSLNAELVAKGVKFNRAFAVNSLCCPSRATILTGQYAHTHGVWSNSGPNGGFAAFDDSSTLATWLDSAGYRTGWFGKYLNGYGTRAYIPPGYDRWLVGSDSYYDMTVNDQGSIRTLKGYSTDELASATEDFIRNSAADESIFAVFAPKAPHSPQVPAERHKGAFANLAPHRPPNYNETDVSDKPQFVQDKPLLSSSAQASLDNERKNQYRTLLAVDEAIDQLLLALEDTGRLANTLIVYASDNGYMWGEHRLKAKWHVYEESIRLPLVVRYDAVVTLPRKDYHLALNLDIAQTIADAAGVTAPGVEGLSLLPLLSDPGASWRVDFLVEHMADTSDGGSFPSYCAVRTSKYLHSRYATGEEELYDLIADPYQLENAVSEPGYADILSGLRLRLQDLCDPPPPGYSFG